MSLQRKFALLLGTLGLIVVINLTTALWSVWVLQHQLGGPLASIGPVLDDLHTIKRAVEQQARLLIEAGLAQDEGLAKRFGAPTSPGPPPGTDARAFAGQITQTNETIRTRLDHLRLVDTFRLQAGLSTSRNIERRLTEVTDEVAAWLQGGDDTALADAGSDYLEIHELIESVEGHVIKVAPDYVAFGGTAGSQVLVSLGASVALMVLAAVLATVLVRRLIMRPVAILRDAAARLARGDFDHRIPVQGSDELALLSSEVNSMAGTIGRLQEERVERERLAAVGEMVRRIAHNLRNPLAGIRSLAELTRGELPADAPARENQDRIVRTVDRFETWLSELLQATTPLQTQPAPTPVRDWLERCLEPLRPMAASRGVEIAQRTDEAPALASIDARHFEQAVVAIVTNAIQCAPNGSRVEVSARRLSENAEGWELRVADEGPGVPEELREKIFRPYFTTRRDGTGIGLAVAKRVVEQHGGQIWVEPARKARENGSAANPGAAFVIRLPLSGVSGVARAGQP